MADTTSAQNSEHHYTFHVKMTCGGCSGAVERVLKKTQGLSCPVLPSSSNSLKPHPTQPNRTLSTHNKTGLTSYNVSLESQTADVYTADVEYETLLEKIKKTGKTVLGAERDGEKLEV